MKSNKQNHLQPHCAKLAFENMFVIVLSFFRFLKKVLLTHLFLFLPQVSSINSSKPLTDNANGKGVTLVPNLDAVLEDFRILGEGLIERIVTKDEYITWRRAEAETG